MIFSVESVEAILAGKKTMTIKLVNEGEFIGNNSNGNFVAKQAGNKYKKKWQVGKDYIVQLGKGKKGVQYCAKCLSFKYQKENTTYSFENKKDRMKECEHHWDFSCWKPLRLQITNIKQERLLDISEEDAKKEGYTSRHEFIGEFFNKNISFSKIPLVWIIEFKVI